MLRLLGSTFLVLHLANYVLQSIAVGLGNHPLRPSTVIQAEGLQAEFFCEDPTGTIDWTLNGTYLRNIDSSDGSIRREGRGSATEALVVRALAGYNNTDVRCIIFYAREDGSVTVELSELARLIVQDQLGEVRNLTSKTTFSTIDLSWKPPFSLNISTAHPDIVYCVDVYKKLMDTASFHILRNCSVFEPYYKFSLENPDPKEVFTFTITPRSNVNGAQNGTATTINATFLYDIPEPLSKAVVNVDVTVGNGKDINITVNIYLRNHKKLSRRPVTYEVSITSISDDNTLACPVLAHEDAENTTLTLNCTKIIKPKQLFKIDIIGINPAGRSIIVRDIALSTHFVQDINTTGSPGQLNISCEFLVDNETTLGYMALVHSDDDVNYLVTANTNEGVVTNHLKGLRSENYTTLLFAISESGLPLQQAAAFPTNVSIIGSFSEQVEEGPNQDRQPDGVFATISYAPDSQNCEIECTFSDTSAATGCIVVYWKNESNSYGLVNFSSSKLDRNGDKANGYIDVANSESGGYNIAVFAYNNSMITGQPLAKRYIRASEGAGSSKRKVDLTATVSSVVMVVVMASVLVGVGALVAIHIIRRKNLGGRNRKPQSHGTCVASV